MGGSLRWRISVRMKKKLSHLMIATMMSATKTEAARILTLAVYTAVE